MNARLTDRQVDEAIDETVDQFIQELGNLTAHCDWATGGNTARLARLDRLIRQEVANMMTYREPRD